MTLEAIKYRNRKLEVLDQRLLPFTTKYVPVCTVEDAWKIIHSMQVRGAPAIALVGCLSIIVETCKGTYKLKSEMYDFIEHKAHYISSSRPTAVNLKFELDKLTKLAKSLMDNPETTREKMLNTIVAHVERLLERDIADNKSIGRFGAKAILADEPKSKKVRILTHCNTGSLATAGFGTALGVIRHLHLSDNLEMVYCTETRPFLQGARLTAYELVYEKIPATLICDNAVGALFAQGLVSAVIVGADRVAANGDTANKIGTYQIAMLARDHGIPFFVASPTTSVDLSLPNGDDIPIEERCSKEITHFAGQPTAAPGIEVWNPAFDVTPASLITSIITEMGVFHPKDLYREMTTMKNVVLR